MSDTRSYGAFDITSGKIRISDPTLPKDQRGHAGSLKKVANGRWRAYGISDKGSIRKLIAIHDSQGLETILRLGVWEPVYFTNGVDSGQTGIFDEDFYQGEVTSEDYGAAIDNGEVNAFNFACVTHTKSNALGGTLRQGAVSCFENGEYDVLYSKNFNDEIVGVIIN